MKLLDAGVEWYRGYHNYPTLTCLVDKIPDMDDMVFEKRGNMYWAENNDFVQFYYHIPSDPTGFGGSVFTLKMNTGEIVKIKGPWSSNAGIMNMNFPHSVATSITDDLKAWKRGYTLCSGHVTLNFADQIADMAGVSLIQNKYGYIPSLDPVNIVKEFEDGYLIMYRGGFTKQIKSLDELEYERD